MSRSIAVRAPHPRWYRHETEEQAAARVAAEEEAKARWAALDEAATLRQAFVRELIAAKGKAPAETLRLVVEVLVESVIGLPAQEDLAFYLGYDEPGAVAGDVVADLVRKAPERRLPALALAVVAVGAEDNVCDFDQRWNYSPAFALRWLSFLAEAGHELTEAEAQLMDEARQHSMKRTPRSRLAAPGNRVIGRHSPLPRPPTTARPQKTLPGRRAFGLSARGAPGRASVPRMAQKPLSPEGGEASPLRARVPRQILSRLEQISQQRGITRSELVRAAVIAYLDTQEQSGQAS